MRPNERNRRCAFDADTINHDAPTFRRNLEQRPHPAAPRDNSPGSCRRSSRTLRRRVPSGRLQPGGDHNFLLKITFTPDFVPLLFHLEAWRPRIFYERGRQSPRVRVPSVRQFRRSAGTILFWEETNSFFRQRQCSAGRKAGREPSTSTWTSRSRITARQNTGSHSLKPCSNSRPPCGAHGWIRMVKANLIRDHGLTSAMQPAAGACACQRKTGPGPSGSNSANQLPR